LLLVGVAGCDLLGSKKAEEKDGKAATTKVASAASRLCAANATYTRLKESAFDEAKRIRERDTEALDALADASVVRMEDPLLESRDEALGLTVCSGRMIVELPPAPVPRSTGANVSPPTSPIRRRRRRTAAAPCIKSMAANRSFIAWPLSTRAAPPVRHRSSRWGSRRRPRRPTSPTSSPARRPRASRLPCRNRARRHLLRPGRPPRRARAPEPATVKPDPRPSARAASPPRSAQPGPPAGVAKSAPPRPQPPPNAAQGRTHRRRAAGRRGGEAEEGAPHALPPVRLPPPALASIAGTRAAGS
jgi:hypothetical protein